MCAEKNDMAIKLISHHLRLWVNLTRHKRAMKLISYHLRLKRHIKRMQYLHDLMLYVQISTLNPLQRDRITSNIAHEYVLEKQSGYVRAPRF